MAVSCTSGGLIQHIIQSEQLPLIPMLMVFILTFIVETSKMHLIIAAVGIVMIVIFIMWLKANMLLTVRWTIPVYQIRDFRMAGSKRYADRHAFWLSAITALRSEAADCLARTWKWYTEAEQYLEAQNDMIFAIICES